MKRRKFASYIAGTLAVVAFLLLSSVAVVWANGLKFNPDTRRFEQTVMVAVEAKKRLVNVQVYLNGEEVGREVPLRVRHLFPGRYEVRVTKDGFHPWQQTFQLSPGQVGLIESVTLIATSPVVANTDVKYRWESTPLVETGLSITEDGELMDGNKLVTRFAQDPVLAVRYKDGYVYQIGTQLRLYFPFGPQDYLLYELSSAEPSRVVSLPNEGKIVVRDGDASRVVNLETVSERPELSQ